jgi:cell division protein ZapA (FtsZ GTPase activity inhibitor)
MSKQAVTISIAGHAYRLVTSLDKPTLERHAKEIERRLGKLAPGQQIHPQALLLVALALSHELQEAREAADELRQRASERITDMVRRVDSALDHLDEDAEPLPAAPTEAPWVEGATELHTGDEQS